MIEAKEPPGWELAPSKFDRTANLGDVFGRVAAYNTAIQADKEPIIHTNLSAVFRLTQQMLNTPAKHMWLKRESGIKVMVCKDCILQHKAFCILMVSALTLPTDCKVYSGRNNDEHQAATTEQAACIHQLKQMLYSDSTINTQAGGYLDGLAILTMYTQCMLLDPLLQY